MNKITEAAVDKWTKWFIQSTAGMVENHNSKLAINQHVRLALVGAISDIQSLPVVEKDGCFFCGIKDNELVFESEFDTYVHIDCVRTRLKEDPLDPEANLMKHIFKPL